MSEINAIVSDWINDTFGGSQSEWIDSGGDSEDFDDFISNLVDDVAEDVEGDLEVMVQDHLQNFRYYDIATTIEAEIAEIEPEEMDIDPR